MRQDVQQDSHPENILDFGARPNSGELCTAAIQAAIDQAGSGTVHIPAGEFLTGTINLKQASLALEKGAVLKGSSDIADYTWNGYEHNELGKVYSLIYAFDADNLCLSGEGTIDLNGDAFFQLDQPIVPISKVNLTDRQLAECTRKHDARPSQPLFFKNCHHMAVSGIRIINAPCWTLTFVESSHLLIDRLTIDNSLILPNNDGIHLCGCQHVVITGCNISAGDDCIAVTGITDWTIPCENIVISNCILRSCSKAIAIGYMHSIVRNVLINNVIILESNRGISVMACHRSGLVENLSVNNVRIDTRIAAGNWWGNGEAFCVMATYHHNPYSTQPIPNHDFPVNIRNVSFSNLQCTVENALAIIGEDDNIADIRLINLAVALKPSENKAVKGNRIDLSPGPQEAALPDDGRPYWLYLSQAHRVTLENIWISPFDGLVPEIYRPDQD